jgi:hypothetical protein
MTTRKISIAEFLKNDEVQRAAQLYKVAEPGTFARRCAAEIIEPQMARINATLGQENDALYLAYMVEYTLMKAGVR